MAMLTSSLTEGFLAQVIDCPTSTQIWATLHDLFVARFSAQVIQTRLQLVSLKKGSETLSEFFNRAKQLSILLAVASQPIVDPEFNTYLLVGLSSD